jgi:sporulation protein YlmC with PRC-barrel domain
MLKYVVAGLVGSLLMVGPALSEGTPPSSSSTSSASNAQTASAAGQWQASKLIRMNVYNNNNEKIGDIKELMLDKSGKIDQVVIGVGGFLGMGEHDVAVKFDQIKWVDEPVRTSAPPAASNRPQGTTGTTATAPARTTDTTKRNYPDHAMLNATKDQLKAMPEFKYNK